jgi:uncharacterized protein YjbI with pentapeptide repeats
MSNPEHLAKLMEGVEAWNQRRNSNPSMKPDLSEANLNEVDLRGVDLRAADLRGADLRGANLNSANLNWADVSDSNFSEAFLRGADLCANLSKADLCRADRPKQRPARTGGTCASHCCRCSADSS